MNDIHESGISLYVHVPFCKTKCPYCDFNTYQGIENLMEPFLEALKSEIWLWGKALGSPKVNTIFFGGGTPSYLAKGELGSVISSVNEAFHIDANAEITIEANPGDLGQEACRELLSDGVNRLSIGVQALNDPLLALLGRRHDAEQAAAAFAVARNAGFSNVNLDLMYGIPRQTMEQWTETLDVLTGLSPEHVSMYCLTLEEGTPLKKWVEEGKLPEPDPDLAADMYHFAEGKLEDAGYHHYEISNWSKPGVPARHNLAYWLNRPFLGVGPGAHSSLGGHRFWDVDSPRGYNQRVQQWLRTPPQEWNSLTAEFLDSVPQVGGREFIDTRTSYGETMFLGLRLLDGFDVEEASEKVGTDLTAHFRSQIDEALSEGLLEWEGGRLRLTKPAYLIANRVFTCFVE